MIQALTLLLFAPLLVSGINVPHSHSLLKRNSRANVPRTLWEKSPDLVARQGTCGIGQQACSTGGCCDGSCCGDGCCPVGYTCKFVGSTPGCCPTGQTCSDVISGCTDPSLVECTGYDFCCPAGQACSLDANGNAQCGGSSIGNGNGNGNGNPTTTTHVVNNPPATTSSPQFSVVNTNTAFGGGNGNNGGLTSVPATTTTPLNNFNTAKPTTSDFILTPNGAANAHGVASGAAAGVVFALVGAAML